MKKTIATAAVIAALVSGASAATITVSLTTTGKGVLSGLGNSTGVQNAYIWGVVVDTAGDGFAGNGVLNPYLADFAFRPTANGTGYTAGVNNPIDTDGQVLSTAAGATDDVLFLSFVGMLNSTYTNDGTGTTSNYRPGSIAGVNYTANSVAGGQAFAIIWFNVLATGNLNTAASSGTQYGMVTNAGATAPSGTDLLLPGAQNGTVDVNSSFVGAETARNAGFVLAPVPEPSAALLGMLGALGLLRRRR